MTMKKRNNEVISKFSKTLFWDTDIQSINPEKHAPYIVERVMTRGTLEDFQHLKAYYGKALIGQIVQQLRSLDIRTLHFCSAYFDIPITQFKCYIQKQSNPSHWNY